MGTGKILPPLESSGHVFGGFTLMFRLDPGEDAHFVSNDDQCHRVP